MASLLSTLSGKVGDVVADFSSVSSSSRILSFIESRYLGVYFPMLLSSVWRDHRLVTCLMICSQKQIKILVEKKIYFC